MEMQADAAKRMLVLADSLDRMSSAIGSHSRDAAIATGGHLEKNLDAMYSQLLSVSGLVPVNPARGDTFDDAVHMAVGIEYSSRHPENSVFRVIRKGYTREGVLIRPAEVIVSKRPAGDGMVKKTSVWNRFLSWASPAHRRLDNIDELVSELECARYAADERLSQEVYRADESAARSAAEREETEEALRALSATIEQLRAEMDDQKEFITRMAAEWEIADDRARSLVATIEQLNREVTSLKAFILQSYPLSRPGEAPDNRVIRHNREDAGPAGDRQKNADDTQRDTVEQG